MFLYNVDLLYMPDYVNERFRFFVGSVGVVLFGTGNNGRHAHKDTGWAPDGFGVNQVQSVTSLILRNSG